MRQRPYSPDATAYMATLPTVSSVDNCQESYSISRAGVLWHSMRAKYMLIAWLLVPLLASYANGSRVEWEEEHKNVMATVTQSQADLEAASQPFLEARGALSAPLEPARDWKREFATSTYAWLSHTATCILLGLLSAVALKLFGPPIATAVVLLFVVVLVLAYYGYVNLNWRTVTTAFLWTLDADRDGRVNLSDCKLLCNRMYGFVIGFGLSAVGGFLLGFWLGMKLL